MVKTIQFIAGTLLLVIFLEAILTTGSAFNFEYYSVFSWIAQIIVVAFAVTTAIRVRYKDWEKEQ
jgi:cytochrome c biogenesis protein CcdA